MPEPLLSVCVATFKRGRFIEETLDTIVAQLSSEVEVIVVDGASPDNTEEVMRGYTARHPGIRYIREAENGGVDADYDKAVGYARGRYCWLMTDDDLMVDSAIATVLGHIRENPDLVVVNASTWTQDFSTKLCDRQLDVGANRLYSETTFEDFFREVGSYLSFIGAVVIRRDAWVERKRTPYYGSLFIHVGVIFQKPLSKTVVVAEPLLRLRLGNAMWTPRSFEIWMLLWPGLVWSFPFSDDAKRAVTPRRPFRSPRKLILERARGGVSKATYQGLLQDVASPTEKFIGYAVAALPVDVCNVATGVYCYLKGRSTRAGLFALANGPHSTRLTRLLAQRAGLPVATTPGDKGS